MTGSTWHKLEARRTLREYESLSQMLDDIWEAHEHGWLPVTMTEKRLPNGRRFPPWRWFSRKSVYTVAYRQSRS